MYQKVLMIAASITVTSVINILGNKYSTAFNKGIMSVIVGAFTLLMVLAGVRGKHFSENAVVPKMGDLSGLLRSSFITIFAYNGFRAEVSYLKKLVT